MVNHESLGTYYGAMTFEKTTLDITTLTIEGYTATLSRIKFYTALPSAYLTTMLSVVMLCAIVLNAILLSVGLIRFDKCHNAECYHAECYAECYYANCHYA
jgi:hypothetical protein